MKKEETGLKKAKDSDLKHSSRKAKKKNKKEAVNNKKHQNNKILKAREILAKNKAALNKESEKRQEKAKRSLPVRILLIFKRLFFGILIAAFAIALISFVVVRVNGGTPDVFGYSIQRIVSGSMEPALQVGDIILCKNVSDPSEVGMDDIITFQGGSDFEYNKVTHRVVVPPMQDSQGDYYLTTKGDANDKLDKEIYFSDVRTKMVTKLDFLNKFYDFFMSPWGLIIFIAALIIIFFDELLTVAKVLTGNYKEEDDEDLKEIMDRLKAEEEEKARLEELRRLRSLKHDNTSLKKRKRRKKNQEKQNKSDIKKTPGNQQKPKHGKNKKNKK